MTETLPSDAADRADRFPNGATPPGSEAYYCIRFGARQGRPELAVLFAWRAEIRRIYEHSREPGVARLKSDWWRREIEASRLGEARHPLAQALSTPMRLHQLPIDPFLEMLDAAEADLLGRPITDDRDLHHHCHQAGGSFAELLTRVSGGADRRLLEQARGLGAYARFAEIIADLGADLRRDRCYLPQDRMARHGLSAERLSSGIDRDGLSALLAELTGAAERLLPGEIHQTGALGPATALTALARATLRETARAGFPVITSRVSLTPLRRLWIAWRSVRRGAI